jgi:hypothetical protein
MDNEVENGGGKEVEPAGGAVNEGASGPPPAPDPRTETKDPGPTTSPEQVSQAAPAEPPPVAKEWYVVVGGQQAGPYDVIEVLQFVREGRLTPADFCWKEGMSQWTPLHAIPEFGPSVQAYAAGGAASRPMIGDKGKQMLDVGKAATASAFTAFLKFVLNPVRGLPLAYRTLPKKGALSAGIVFIVAAEICLLMILMVSGMGQYMPFGVWVRSGIFMLMPAVGFVVALGATRKMTGSLETIHADFFVGGSAHLVLGLLSLVTVLLMKLLGANALSAILVLICSCYLVCYVVLILYSGLLNIYGLNDSKASLLVPLILVIAACLMYLVNSTLMEGAMTGMMGGPPSMSMGRPPAGMF